MVEPNDEIAALVHEIQQQAVSATMGEGHRGLGGLLIPPDAVDKLMIRYAFTSFDELDDEAKAECRCIASHIQEVFIGRGDDDEQ